MTKNEEEALVAEQARDRGVAIATKHREREIAVEAERVEKARQLEVIGREREVSLGGIARDKELEVQKKEIANVVRERISVEKSVAAEEELIKDIRTVAQANREKETVRIAAEAAATEQSVKQVKAAQASEEVTKIKARERVVAADAELETADKGARAKIRLAEGVQAEAAAEGLAKARVKEADAAASEKLGLTEARVALEKLTAQASGEEKQGLAKVRVREAEAAAVEKQGSAEANAIRERLVAEAQGLAQKAESMKALDQSGRGHEEFRLRMEKERTVAIESLKAKKDIVAAQSRILAEAMGKARINIVGGDGQFFERFISAISLGQSVDGALGESDTLRALVAELSGRSDGSSDLLGQALERLAQSNSPAEPQGQKRQ
ncbi:MAG: hypothetical protein QM756_40710 [Polyangiaceae bacterium]